jgi:hypothetical protein
LSTAADHYNIESTAVRRKIQGLAARTAIALAFAAAMQPTSQRAGAVRATTMLILTHCTVAA